MQIQTYTLSQLLPLLETDFFKKSPVLPISRHRAISHYHNPRAKTDDQVLWLLFEKEELVAYRLVLPDTVYHKEKAIRMAWVSCVYVNPNKRGKGYGKQLTQLALEAWDNKLMGTEFAPESRSMYKKMGVFEDFHTSTGFRGYLRMSLAKILTKRNPKLRILYFGLWIIDGIINIFQGIRLAFYKNPLDTNIQLATFDKVNDESWAFIESRQENELTHRNQSELNWLLTMPWIIDPSKDKGEAKRFHFSSVDHPFKQECVQVFYQEQLIGVLILTHRGKALKVPYAYFDKPHTALIASVIKSKAVELKVDTLTLYQAWLSEYLHHQKAPFLLVRKIKRYYLRSHGFPDDFTDERIEIQDGVGDAGFT